MTLSVLSAISFIRALRNDRRGAIALMLGLSIPVLIGFAGIVVDVGHVFSVQSQLQASSDAAAMAGAQQIVCTVSTSCNPVAAAYSYSSCNDSGNSSCTGAKNVIPNVTVTMPSAPATRCFSSTGVSCIAATGNVNGIVVTQQAAVPTYFARLFGFGTFTVRATSAASAAGGTFGQADVVIVLDTTASMNNSDSACGDTRLNCAFAGIQQVLKILSPALDQVALMTFPAIDSATQTAYYNCSGAVTPNIVAYTTTAANQTTASSYATLANDAYLLKMTSTPTTNVFSTDYRTSPAATTLNTSSPLVRLVTRSTCPVVAKGGQGTYYPNVITAAQAVLTSGPGARPKARKVIIVVGDGDSPGSGTSTNMPYTWGATTGTKGTNECQWAINQANVATNTGTWIFSLAYGADTTTGSCTSDTASKSSVATLNHMVTGYQWPTMPVTACKTMQNIASDPSKFYSDDAAGKCSSSVSSIMSLLSAFSAVATYILYDSPRLLPPGTT